MNFMVGLLSNQSPTVILDRAEYINLSGAKVR